MNDWRHILENKSNWDIPFTQWGKTAALALLSFFILLISFFDNRPTKSEYRQLEIEIINLKQDIHQLQNSQQELIKENEEKDKLIEELRRYTDSSKKTTQTLNPNDNLTISCEQYLPIIRQYEWDHSIAYAIMKAESGCNPNAISPTNDHGLFQLHGIAEYIPAKNIEIAYKEKYLKGGWKHWTVYKTGTYKKYL